MTKPLIYCYSYLKLSKNKPSQSSQMPQTNTNIQNQFGGVVSYPKRYFRGIITHIFLKKTLL